MSDVCVDNRFEIIEKAKKHIIEATNIAGSPEEMKVLDTILFRCWQMGWLKQYESRDDGIYADFFAMKDGVRYDTKCMNVREITLMLTNNLVDGIEKIIA